MILRRVVDAMKRITLWLIIVVVFLLVSIFGFMITLDLTFIDALYMTIITISTVGYESVGTMSTAGKLFAIFVILVSVGLVGYLLSQVFSIISEGTINEAWRKKKMMKEIDKLEKHIIVCGAGESGSHVIKELIKKEANFVVIENDPEVIEELKDLNLLYIEDDATNEEALLTARIKEASGLITTLPTDADNVFVVLTARVLNPSLHIIARNHELSSRKKLIRAGANNVVSPDEIGGKKMANLMLSPHVQFFVDNIIDTKNMSINMEEVIIFEGSELIGKKLRNSEIADKAGLIVLAIRRNEDEFIFNPKADEVLRLEDKLIVVGSKEQIEKLEKMASQI
jgi:voltage-gated potassium channel